jgi:hypothetical protein
VKKLVTDFVLVCRILRKMYYKLLLSNKLGGKGGIKELLITRQVPIDAQCNNHPFQFFGDTANIETLQCLFEDTMVRVVLRQDLCQTGRKLSRNMTTMYFTKEPTDCLMAKSSSLQRFATVPLMVAYRLHRL